MLICAIISRSLLEEADVFLESWRLFMLWWRFLLLPITVLVLPNTTTAFTIQKVKSPLLLLISFNNALWPLPNSLFLLKLGESCDILI